MESKTESGPIYYILGETTGQRKVPRVSYCILLKQHPTFTALRNQTGSGASVLVISDLEKGNFGHILHSSGTIHYISPR